MAPNRGPSGRATAVQGSSKSSRNSNKTSQSSTKIRSRVSKRPKAPPPKQQKTKSSFGPVKKKRRVYTDKELGLPKLNMITPVGVEKPKGKKKGKVFIDDRESMMMILAMVNADMEGQIESKMMKSRQMEEIREARKNEAEARQEERRSKLEETKDSIRRRRKRASGDLDSATTKDTSRSSKTFKASKKRVSFA